MDKIKKVVKYADLPQEAMKALVKKYPEGWKDYVRKITKPNGEFFYAINVDTETASYLVKVDVKIDTKKDIERIDDRYIDKTAEKEAEDHSREDEVEADEVED